MNDTPPPAATLPVFFSPAMVADARSFSPSAEKPAHVVARWQALGLPLTIHPPTPVTPDDLALAHDPAFVADILAGRRPNGFGNTSAAVAASLPHTTGAMLSAARLALAERRAVAAPCSGFHHAGYARAAGFCTFNGLMVTACALVRDGLARRVAILDCDMHYGDGTDDILERLRPRVRHFTAGARYDAPADARPFLETLPSIVASMADCDVILYQAGADPHVDDPLGGWLTDAQLEERDRLVFTSRVPIAWNLAGGYQRDAQGGIAPVLAIHRATARACLASLAEGQKQRERREPARRARA